jgi:3-hydroxyisobutyrate dehydrogenase-like beta-hydroxyacid dehydrogenase
MVRKNACRSAQAERALSHRQCDRSRSTGAVAAETLVLAKKAGLDPRAVYAALKDSAATSKMFQIRGRMIAENQYDPAMCISTYLKHIGIIGDFAASARCPTPLFSVCAHTLSRSGQRRPWRTGYGSRGKSARNDGRY